MEPAADSLPPVLTVPEVAEFLRVTPKTVYGLVKRGELPSFRVGRTLRCRREDVQQFIAAKTEEEGFRQSEVAGSVRGAS